MRYFYRIGIICLLGFVSFSASAMTRYMGVGFASGWLTAPKEQHSTSFETGVNERTEHYTGESANTGNINLALGYEIKPLFGSSFIASNDVGLLFDYNFPYKVEGERREYHGSAITTNDGSEYHYNINTMNLIADYQVNFNMSPIWMPYVDFGLGLSRYTFHNFQEGGNRDAVIDNTAYANKSGINFAYEAGLGVKYMLAKNNFLSLGYHYQNLGKMKSGAGEGMQDNGTLRSLGTLTQKLIVNQVYLRYDFKI